MRLYVINLIVIGGRMKFKFLMFTLAMTSLTVFTPAKAAPGFCPENVRVSGSISNDSKGQLFSQLAGKWLSGNFDSSARLYKPVVSTDGFQVVSMQIYRDLVLVRSDYSKLKPGVRCTYIDPNDDGQSLVLYKYLK